MGSKQSGTQTVEQKADPWSGAQPYLTGRAQNENGYSIAGILPNAQRLYKNAKVNPFNGDELAAMKLMRGRVGRDYGLVDTGLDTLQRTARGDFLGQQNFMDAYGEGILNDVNSQFARAGRAGSGYAAQAAAKGLAQGAAPLYAQERQLQQQAALSAPQYQAGQYGLLDADIDALMQAGFMKHNRPYENLQNYANIVLPSAGQGGTSSSSQPMYRNPVAGGLGGALAGSQLAPLIGMTGPMGAGIGLGLGLLGM